VTIERAGLDKIGINEYSLIIHYTLKYAVLLQPSVYVTHHTHQMTFLFNRKEFGDHTRVVDITEFIGRWKVRL